jgi:hypothetical protein
MVKTKKTKKSSASKTKKVTKVKKKVAVSTQKGAKKAVAKKKKVVAVKTKSQKTKAKPSTSTAKKKSVFSFLFSEKESKKELASSKKSNRKSPELPSKLKSVEKESRLVKESEPKVRRKAKAETDAQINSLTHHEPAAVGCYDPVPFRGSSFKLKLSKILTAEGWKRIFES